MVRAFSGLLRRDPHGQHWLVTPHEQQAIAVDDAAFLATDVAFRDGALVFRLNTDDTVVAGPDHPLTARGDPDLPTPAHIIETAKAAVRHGQTAPAPVAGLVELAGDNLTVSSQGARFSLVPA